MHLHRIMNVTICFVVICFLSLSLEVECKTGDQQHRKNERRGRSDGHHRINGGKKGKKLANGPDKQEIHNVKIGWLSVPEVSGCKCAHSGQICIKGPHKEPICVQRHHLEESARLFKHYHDRKEKAEKMLTETDPPPHSTVHEALNDASYDNSQSNKKENLQDMHQSLDPKPGKHHLHPDYSSQKSQHIHRFNSQTERSCDHDSLDEMRQRLTSWFHLLHSKNHVHQHSNHQHHKSHRHQSVKKELRQDGNDSGRCKCLRSVMWEFHQIDVDKSHSLSKDEMKVVDNNDMEPCLHPYLLTCDRNMDGLLSRQEWCCCFLQKESELPCYAKLNEIEATKNTEKYLPSCDHEGYYHKEQCMGSTPGTQSCWCVTPSGSEIPGSRTIGRAHCGKLDSMGYPKNMS